MYPFGVNWDELTKNGDRVFLYYKTNFHKTVEYICEFCYAIERNNEIKIVGVYGATSRGVSIEDALKRYNITIEQYEQNIDRVLST